MMKRQGIFCLFCLEIHLSTRHFTQFYRVTKIYIEMYCLFVYNVRIAVPCTLCI